MTVEDGLIRTHGGMACFIGPAENSATAASASFQDARSHDNSGVFIRSPSSRARVDACPYATKCKSTTSRKNPTRRLSHHRHALLAHQASRETRKPGPGVDTMVITWTAAHIVASTTSRSRLYRRPARSRPQFDFEPQHGTRPTRLHRLQNHSKTTSSSSRKSAFSR